MSCQVDNASQALDWLERSQHGARWTAFVEDNVEQLQANLEYIATVREALAAKDRDLAGLRGRIKELEEARANHLIALAAKDEEIERLRRDQEKVDAWWRARSEVKIDGNSRAEYVLQRDAAWERAEAAEAENRRLTEGLREIAENRTPTFRRSDHSWAERYEKHEAHARALLAGSEAEPDGRKWHTGRIIHGDDEPDGGGAK